MLRLFLILWLCISSSILFSQSVNFSATENEGCVPLISSFEIQNLSDASFISWDFGNGTLLSGNPMTNPILMSPTIAYIDYGVYTVILTYTLNGITESITRNEYIKAYSIPNANFTSDNTIGCGSFTIQFIDEAFSAYGAINSWHWDFGNGFESNEQNPSSNYYSEGLYDVTLSVSTIYGCEETYIEANHIIALEGPNTSFELNTNFACDLPFELIINNTTSSANPLSYLWDFDNGESSDEEEPGSVIYTEYGLYTINLSALDPTTCAVDYNQTLLIQPMEASFEYSYGCSPTWITFNNSSTFGLIDFSWDFGDPLSGDDNTDTTFHAIHYYSDAGTYPITLIGQNDGGCTDSLTIEMEIEDAPFDIELSESFICELPASPEVTIPVDGINSVNWVLLDSLGLPVFSGGGTNFTFEFDEDFITYDEDFYHLSLEIEYDDGCYKEIYLANFLSIVVPKLSGFIENINGCSPLEVTFLDSSTFPYGFSEIQWNLGNGEFAYGSEINYTYSDTGDYFTSLTLTTIQGCQIDTVFRDPVEVGTHLNPSFSYISDTLCHNEPFTVIYHGPYIADSLYWLYSGVKVKTLGNVNEVELSAISICNPINLQLVAYNNGCSDTTSQLLDSIYFKGPQAIFNYSTKGLCVENGPLLLDLQNVSCSTSENDSILYQWNINIGDSIFSTDEINPPAFELFEPGFYSFSLSANSTLTSCESEINDFVMIDYLDIQLSNYDSIGCHPFQLVESAFSETTSGVYSNFSWIIDNPDTIMYFSSYEFNAITPLFPDTGNYWCSITGISLNGCVDTMNYLIRSSPIPIADFVLPDSIQCSPSTIQLIDSSYGENPIQEWEWILYGWENAEDSIQNPFFDLNFPTPYAVSLTSTDIYDCTSEPHTELLYPPLIFAELGIPDALCNGEEYQITNYSYGTEEPFTYYWDFGNGQTSNEAEPIITYNSVTVSSYYYISVTITNSIGCNYTYEDSILISVPIFDLFASLDSSISCPPVFADIIPIGNDDIFSYQIQYGDGDTNTIYMDSSITSFSHVYEFPGYYDIILTATDTNHCFATAYYDSLVLIAGPYAEFTYTPNNGCPPLDVEFTITNQSGVDDYIWVFGDGGLDSIESPINTYLNAGEFYPVLVVQDSINWASGDTLPCIVAIIGDELIVEGPIVDFTVDEDTLCFGGGEVNFTNQTIPASGYEITSWDWDFGDGSSSSEIDPPPHSYTEPGSYIVSLTANTDIDCVYFKEKIAVVVLDFPDLIPSLEYEIDCPSMPVQFYADTSIWQNGISSIEWDFGDGNFSDEWFPLHFYDEYGSFSASVDYIIFNCLFEYPLYDTIITYPQPSAQYISYPLQNDQGIYGQLFENNSIGEVAVNWLVDSIFLSSENEVEINFENYPILLALVAINEFSCTDTNYIDLWEYYDDTAPNVITPNEDGVNDYFKIDLSDIKDCVDLKVYNRWGQLLFEDPHYQNTWDGTNLYGNPVPDGTYFYIADICNKTQLKGYITIIR